ncbi:MAG: hypothetical protein MJ058_07590 [Akkermansia sp.]|nr:hypothetical protein [Akkermansia sp.]
MKIASIIVTGMLMGMPAVAQEAPAAPAPAPAAEAATPEAQHAAFVKELIANVNELTEALKGVTDTATADAAAPKVAKLVAHNKELMQASKDLPQLAPDAAAAQRALFSQQAKPAMAELRTALVAVVTKECYGSDALLQALAPIIH